MKTYSRLLLYISIIAFTVSCSKDDGTNTPNATGKTYIKYSVNGTVVNGEFKIEIPDNTNNTHAISLAGDVETEEGTKRVAQLEYYSTNNNRGVTLMLPASTGSFALGEVITTGVHYDFPTYYMEFNFDPETDAYFDEDGDGNNDVQSSLVSETISATITEYEETQNNLGIATLAHIKGSFEGSAYLIIDPTLTNPEEVPHTVTGEFEYYYLPEE